MSLYPNKTIDHLNPANWWPAYDGLSDRRAIPAAALLVLDADLNAYFHDGLEPGIAQEDGWRHLVGVDQTVKTKAVILEWGRAADREVPPDHLVYIAQRDFERQREEIIQALGRVYDDLWAFHQAGQIGRADFERRAGVLRELRDTFTNNAGVLSNES